MRRFAIVPLLVLLPLTSCTGQQTAQSLSQCMVGDWQNPLLGGCLCPTEPECQSSDCQAITFESFTANGTYFSGTVTWSNQAKTMSTEGAASTGTYSVTDGGTVILVSNSNAKVQQMMTCSGSALTVNGANFVRANGPLSRSLDGALATGLMWKGYPIAQ